MNLKASLGLFLVLLLSSCTVTLRKEEIAPAVVNQHTLVAPVDDEVSGLVYALPKTGLRFTVTSQKIEKTRGEFYLYSERYLGLQDVVLEDAVEWEIASVSVEPFGVANPDETYQILFSEDASLPLVQLSEDGVLLSINSDEVATQEACEKVVLQSETQATIPYTEEMLLANSSAKMAQEAANYIYRLRESRTALVSADLDALPPDGEAYAMSLQELSTLESQFVSLFKGQETSSYVTEVIDYIPEEIKAKEVLFRFSSFNGVVVADDLSGSPYFITMNQGDAKQVTSASPDSTGLYYKKPASIAIEVLDGSTPVLEEQVLMGQFGELQTLAPYLLNDKVKIQLYPATGGLKAIRK